ncbi:MAG: PAS domain S-box protein [Polaromonas sp.]|uniref:7TM diverse intracellular signaling domain-containing protein n=1 Tax=Polaromonas sp. TaxID=1869339 RepID=UPI001797F183|nr:7TM diverse intracellular signaling domain-containing protein [Polaromonas sp.]MBA3594237.1 PAS domain S-box protein [Polaromonas sp.]
MIKLARHFRTSLAGCVAALLLAVLVVAPQVARAQVGALDIGNAGSYSLSRAFMVLEDPGAALTLDEVLKPALQAQFRPVVQSGSATNFGLTRSAFWLRIRLQAQPDTPAPWLLEVAYPALDQVELYQPAAGGGYTQQRGGDLEPFANRAVPHRNHVMPVTLQAGQAHVIYLRVQSQGTLSAPVRLWQASALWAHDQAEYALLSLYFGLLIGLLLYNLLLYGSVRDRAYLIYVGFVAGMAVAQVALTGLGAQFLWPDQVWWNSVSPPVGMAVAAAFGLLFACNFLAAPTRMPRMNRLMLVLVGGWLMALLAALTLPYTVSSWMVTVLAVVSVATVVLAGVFSVRDKHPGARYFLIAWAVLLLGVTTLVLHNTGVLPSNLLTANALLIGSALEMLLLSFALADRINVVQAEKEQAQAATQAEHAMVEALSQSQERYRTVLQERETILANSIVGIAFLTAEGRFRWANQAMRDILGVGDQIHTSMEPFYLSREEYLRVGGEVAACIREGRAYQTEIQMLQYDGARIWISLSGKAVSPRDLSQGTVWVMMDITRRKELEAELLRTSSEREAILNSALVGIVLSVARKHEWVNEKFAEMVGYPRDALIGHSSERLHIDSAAWASFGQVAAQALRASGTHACELQLRRRNGELFWVQMGGNCLRPEHPEAGVIWTFLDITERKKSEEDTREALAQQRELNELRSRFVAMTSHEFRTPLATILSSGEILKHYGDRLPAQEKSDTLDSIADSVQRMMRMLDRVLLIGKAEAQMLEFKPRPLDLQALCHQLIVEARLLQPGSQCELQLDYAAGVEPGLYDEKLLRHIFSNLLSNALKYSPGGGHVLFRVSADKQGMVFEVSDQGIGIPADELSHLFESFHRASNVGSIPGTGLGLAIVKNAVNMHGGSVSVSSQAGAGTCFTVRLPVPADAQAGA